MRQPIRDGPVLRVAGRMMVIMIAIRSLDHRAGRRRVVIVHRGRRTTVVDDLAILRGH